MRTGNLRLFCDVALTQSFTAAARLHGCTPASASQSFHALEREFAMELAVPGLRRIHLNYAGQVCQPYCRQIVFLEDALVAKLDQIRAGAGTLEIAACSCIGLYRLPPLLHAFQQAFPDITVRVRLESHDGVQAAVRHNDVDAGLVPYPRHEPGLAVAVFRRVPLMLACHPAHPLAAQPLVTVKQLKNRPIVVWNQVPWLSLLKGVGANERHFFEPRHTFDDVESAIEAVMAGLGVAVLPASLVRDEVAQRRLAAVPFENGRHLVPVAALHRKRRHVPPALQKFLQFLQQPDTDIPSPLPEGGERVRVR
jgi:DNA-binding transcriptional LysR family regulator